MDEKTRSIGAIARESGLSVSALRFYDSADVLAPSWVDPVTGYRWYTADQVNQARLIATLRRVGMPISDICKVLAIRHDRGAAGALLDQHLQALEAGLLDARRHLATARDLLDQQERSMTTQTSQTTMTVRVTDLSEALTAVRYAVSNDPELLALGGVLFDYDGGALRLVATDRYRMSVVTVTTREQQGPAVQVIAPLDLLDEAALLPGEEVLICLGVDAVQIGDTRSAAIDAAFPDYQRLLRTSPARQVSITTKDLTQQLRTGPTRTLTQAPDNTPHEVSVMLVTGDSIEVIEHDHPDAVAVNREFLLQAIDAGNADQLLLALDGPVTPLAIRDVDRPDDISLLMPTRLVSQSN